MMDGKSVMLPLPPPHFEAGDFPSARRVVCVPQGGLLVTEGETPGDRCWLLIEGELEVCLEDAAGHETTLYRLNEGELVGEMALLGGIPRSATVTAVRDSRLLLVPSRVLEEAMLRQDMLLRLVSHCFARYCSSHEVIRRLSPVKVSHRLAHYLLSLPEWQHARGGCVSVSLPTHAELGRLLACQRESITRAFRGLRAVGAVDDSTDGRALLRRMQLDQVLAEG